MSEIPFAELQRWSQEVARDPAAPAFIALAESYRLQGRTEAAIQLCVRALAQNPAHLEGHALLARLYLELGDQERAGDEWSILLRLDPDHFEAHRGLGLFWLERGRPGDARRHLEEAATLRPGDAVVLGALEQLEEMAETGVARAVPALSALLTNSVAHEPAPALVPAPASPAAGQVFAPLLEDPSCMGVMVLDARGLIVAGGLKAESQGNVEALAALLGGVLGEAARVLDPIGGGPCGGIVLETAAATLRLVPFGGGCTLVVLAAPGTPAGWLPRMAQWAAELGGELVEVGS
jgi:tetratricopeptide (TPR) repeat protein